MKTDSNKKLARRRDAAAVTESLALSEMVELYIFSQRCFLLINPRRVFPSRRCCQYAGCLPASHLFVTRLLPWNKRLGRWIQHVSGRLRERRPPLASPLSQLLTAALLGLVFMSVSLSEKPRKFGCEQLRNIILGKHIFPTRLRVTNTGEATV